MAIRHPSASWPGVLGVRSATYTISHGITPGTIALVTLPQPNPPALAGDFVITDGVGTIVIPDCKVQAIHAQGPDPGFTWVLEITDRRWKWRDPLSAISGMYNQPDESGQFLRPPPDAGPQIGNRVKYIPWTIKTPRELAALCLDAMGEVNYNVFLLPNLALPAVNWDYTNPALALQQLVESMGCRVVYRLDTNTVLIAPIGFGDLLPPGSIGRESPAISIPPRPDSIILVGGPVRYQAPLLLEAVGEDWDGQIRPINALTYAPPRETIQQIVEITPANVVVGKRFAVRIDANTYSYVANFATVADVLAGLAAAFNINNILQQRTGITFVNDGTMITLTGDPSGVAFTIGTLADAPSTLTWKLVKAGVELEAPWAYSAPPSFSNVTVTDRLNRFQGMSLARKSVFKYYRILNLDPAFNDGRPFNVPTLGPIQRIQQLLLGDTQVDPTIPEREDENIRGLDGVPLIKDYYDGYSRERRAACYGAYDSAVAGVRIINPNPDVQLNTPKTERVWVDFSIDPERHLVMFSNYVLEKTPWGVKAPTLILLTSFQVRNVDNNQVIRTLAYFNFPPPFFGTPPAYIRHEDVQLGVAARFQLFDLQINVIEDNAIDMQNRALYYLAGEAAKYQISGGLTRLYNGIMPVWLDGATQQVTWEVGEGGAKTTVSVNTEHAVYLPTLPERNRIEYLRAPDRIGVFGLGAGQQRQLKPGTPFG